MKKIIVVLIIILFLFILFFGCKNDKKTNEIPAENNEIFFENNEIPAEKEKINEIIEIPYYKKYEISSKRFNINRLEDIEYINNFSQEEIKKYIEEISINDWSGENNNNLQEYLKYIEKFSNIKKLDIRLDNKNINLEPLLLLKNIEELNIVAAEKIDISTISKLKTLKSLTLYECDEIKDISAIGNLKNLEILKITYCDNIKNINSIFDLSRLKKLYLNIEKMPDFTQINKLTNLEYFEAPVIIDENIINSLSKLKRIKKIKIKYAGVKDVSPLYKIPGFEEIESTLDLHKAISNCYDSYHGVTDPDAIETVKLLLEYGANPNERKQGESIYLDDSFTSFSLETEITPLMQSRLPAVTEMLIKYGARVNDQDKYGRTSLMISAFFDEKNNDNLNMKVLLKNGADVNFKKNTGQTALYLAAINNNIASVKILLNNGADINLRDNKGLSPLMAAKIFIYHENINKMEQIFKNAGVKMNDADIRLVNKIKEDRGYYDEMAEVLSMEINLPGDH